MSAHDTPQKVSQRSRKRKNAWRRYIDLTNIENGLSAVRDENIHGGPIREKAAEELYSVDATGSDQIRKAHRSTHKPLKVDEVLARRSAIPALESHKRSDTAHEAIEPSNKRRKCGGISCREFERLRSTAKGSGSASQLTIFETIPGQDIWKDQNERNVADSCMSFLEKQKLVKAPKTMGQAPVSLLSQLAPPPAVPNPKPAASYNPLFQDWDAALTKDGLREVEAEKKRLRDAEHEEQQQDMIEAGREELEHQTEEESAWEGFESENELESFTTGPRPKRKTQAERNRIKRRKQEESHRRAEAREKQKAHQAREIRKIVTEMKSSARLKNLSQNSATLTPSSETDEVEMRRRRFGKHRLPEPPLEIVLPDELQDSLRRLKPVTNLLSDRFRNVQIQGKLETRRHISYSRQRRRTYTDKWTHKDFVLPV